MQRLRDLVICVFISRKRGVVVVATLSTTL